MRFLVKWCMLMNQTTNSVPLYLDAKKVKASKHEVVSTKRMYEFLQSLYIRGYLLARNIVRHQSIGGAAGVSTRNRIYLRLRSLLLHI